MDSSERQRPVGRPGRPRWMSQRRPGRVADVTVALAVGAVQITGTVLTSGWQEPARSLDARAFALVGLNVAALALRRRFPIPVLLVLFMDAVLYGALGYPAGLAFLPLLVAVLAEIFRVRREHRRATEQRDAAAVQARDEAERRHAVEERLRIAREMHAAVAHAVSVINMQAGVALHLMEERPEQARTALTAIKRASKEALGELRSTLAVLHRTRDPADIGGTASTGDTEDTDQADEIVAVDPPSPTLPVPPLATSPAEHSLLGDLPARASAAGLTVRTKVAGEPRPLPPGVDLAAFRIVQEALTNVARHARPAAATVLVTYSDHALIVQVDDDGHSVPRQNAPDRGGAGIRGMRERALALGGQLEAGPRPGGGFRVRARLPLDSQP